MKDIEPQYAGLARLVGLFDAASLAADTELLDMRGLRLREGATLMLSAHPSGALMVQGKGAAVFAGVQVTWWWGMFMHYHSGI
jgi:hypothetical protein